MAKEIKKVDSTFNGSSWITVYTVPPNKVAEVHITDIYTPANASAYVGAIYVSQYANFSESSIGYEQNPSSHGDADAFVNGSRLSPRKVKMIDGQNIRLYSQNINQGVRFKAIIIEEDIGVQ